MEIGEFRRGEVIATRPDGGVEVEWDDGTTSVLPPKKKPALDIWRNSSCTDKRCYACNPPNTTEETP